MGDDILDKWRAKGIEPHPSDQLERTAEAVDKTKTTLVMQHFPLHMSGHQEHGIPFKDQTTIHSLFEGFGHNKVAMVTGHDHHEQRKGYTLGGTKVVDYTAGY